MDQTDQKEQKPYKPRKRLRGYEYSTEDIIDALERARGGIYVAAQLLGCEASTIFRRAQRVERVAAVIAALRGKRVDVAELALDKAVQNGEPWAIQFTLRFLGRDRGYSESLRHELTGEAGAPIRIVEIVSHAGGGDISHAGGEDTPLEDVDAESSSGSDTER